MADFLGLMKQAAELKSKMEALQTELEAAEVEGVSGALQERDQGLQADLHDEAEGEVQARLQEGHRRHLQGLEQDDVRAGGIPVGRVPLLARVA